MSGAVTTESLHSMIVQLEPAAVTVVNSAGRLHYGPERSRDIAARVGTRRCIDCNHCRTTRRHLGDRSGDHTRSRFGSQPVWLSLSQTPSGWRLIGNRAMLLLDFGFVQTDLWNGDRPASVTSSA